MRDIFWTCLFLVAYVYVGYYLLLKVLAARHSTRSMAKAQNVFQKTPPSVSVIVAAHNEEASIIERINNVISLNYPTEKLEIVIASDGSSDRTADLVRSCGEETVRLLDFKENRGRAVVHNEAVEASLGDVLIFTDAETKFDIQFMQYLIPHFVDESIGCVVGNLVYKEGDNAIAEAEGFYWKFEKKLRKLESDLGILATATGACMAVRKDLWNKLGNTDDVDFVTPLDIIGQGYRVLFETRALAYDFPPQSMKSEFNTRMRQTSRNLRGTLRRWTYRHWIMYPVVSWSLLSHKLLRWMTPYLFLGLFLSSFLLYDKSWGYSLTFVFQLLFYFLAILGYFASKRSISIPLVGSVFAFCVANVGMAVGVLNALVGKIPAVYNKAQ